MRSRPIKPGGNEYAWNGKGPGLKPDQNLFFYEVEIFGFK